MKNCLTTYVANLSQMRNHVGDHILCGLQGVEDTNIDVSGNQEIIWKYNALYHLIAEHSNGGILPEIPGELLVKMFIHKKEEQALGIGK
jgi:hypothetical protein